MKTMPTTAMPHPARLALAAISALALCGCNTKPPACDAPATLGVIQDIFYDHIAKTLRPLSSIGHDDKKLMPLIRANAEVKLTNILTEGYDEPANKISCAAGITITLVKSPALVQPLKVLRAVGKLNTDHSDPLGLRTLYIADFSRQLRLPKLPDVTGVEINGEELSGPIKFASTFASDPKEGKKQYVSVMGIAPFIESTLALATAGGFENAAPK